jgi:hypothetical protein
MKTISGRVAEVADRYWQAGVVRGLLVVDGVALCICLVDAARFKYSGQSLTDAVRVTTEKAAEGEAVVLAAAVLMFFCVALPMVIVLLSSLLAPRALMPRYLREQGNKVLAAHLLLSAVIASFTMLAMTMEVLAGYENNEGVKYSFASTWLGIVLLGKPLWVSYVSPIIRKFFIRIHEKPDIREVAKEVLTEESVGPERAA